MSNINISEIHLYELLSEKLGKDTAKSVTTYIEQKIDKELKSDTKNLATKDDVISLQKWIIGLFVTLSLMILGLYATILLK